MTTLKKDTPKISLFADLANSIHPSKIPVEDSEDTVRSWVRVAATIIESETGLEIEADEDYIFEQLCDIEWIIICGNPEDEDDDRDFIDLKSAGRQLDRIVERTIRWIKDDLEDCREEHRFFKDNEGNLYTGETLRYEYDSFMETLPKGDAYQGMSFSDWIQEWFLSGCDADEITEEEYNKLLAEKDLLSSIRFQKEF